MPIVAGVDVSTQSSTVELRDADTGALLGSGRSLHPRTRPPVSEQDPRAWWSAFGLALAAASESAATDLRDIRAISVGGQCHGLVMLDSAGQPLRDAKLWNDTTSSPQAARMVAESQPQEWADAVGSVPTAAFTITKLAWIADHEPWHLERLQMLLLPHDYVNFRLTGRTVTDRSEASGTGYYAAHEGRWRLDLLERWVAAREWEGALPTVLQPDQPAGFVMPSVADELGLGRDVLVGPGGGDQHLGAVGLGLASGEVAYSLGTSGVVCTVSDVPVFDASGDVDGVADCTGGYLPLASTLNATKVTDWAASLLGVDVQALGEMALAPAASDRPVLAAYLDGERTPNRPGGTGVLAGLTTATTREEFARSAFEGVLLGLTRAHERIRDAGAPADGAVTITGGGARSTAFRQILADLLQAPVALRDADEATARGAAIQAAAVLRGREVSELAAELRPATLLSVEPLSAVSGSLRERYLAAAKWTGADRKEV